MCDMMNINAVLDPTKGNLLRVCQLLKINESKLWRYGSFNDLARLSQGSKKRTIKGINTIHFISPDQKPTNKRSDYARIVVSFRPQKEDSYRVQITVEGQKSIMQVKPSLQMLKLPQPNASSTVLSAPNLPNS